MSNHDLIELGKNRKGGSFEGKSREIWGQERVAFGNVKFGVTITHSNGLRWLDKWNHWTADQEKRPDLSAPQEIRGIKKGRQSPGFRAFLFRKSRQREKLTSETRRCSG